MSIQAVAWALEQDLPARPKLVLVSIANHANHTDGYCWLKAETIASEAACKPRSVFRFVGDLIRNGYLRKAANRGKDGRQRANDYWLLLAREPAPWVAVGPVAEDEEMDTDAPVPDEAEPQDVVEPYDSRAHGENEEIDAPPPVDKHTVSCGPDDSGVSHSESLNHPNLNQKQDSAREPQRTGALRAYRPPPPQPVAADTEAKGNPIFVFDRTPAYEAWQAHMMRKTGARSWHLLTKKLVDGQWRMGWYFPSLFPPAAKPPPSEDEQGRDTAA